MYQLARTVLAVTGRRHLGRCFRRPSTTHTSGGDTASASTAASQPQQQQQQQQHLLFLERFARAPVQVSVATPTPNLRDRSKSILAVPVTKEELASASLASSLAIDEETAALLRQDFDAKADQTTVVYRASSQQRSSVCATPAGSIEEALASNECRTPSRVVLVGVAADATTPKRAGEQAALEALDAVESAFVLQSRTRAAQASTEAALRSSVVAASAALQRLKAPSAVLPLHRWVQPPSSKAGADEQRAPLSPEHAVRVATQAAALSGYSFGRYLTTPKESNAIKNEEREVELLLPASLVEQRRELECVVNETLTIAQGTLYARDLGNERADVANPDFLESQAQGVAALASDRLSLSVIRGTTNLETEGLRMLAAVGQGARWEPRLLVLEYRGAPSGDDSELVALVGKGLTFDSGGLNLKPTGSIEEMHMDMCGAAAVLGTMATAARLNVRKNIVAVMPVCENAIDALAYKPYAILHSHAGKTVQVGNTDAEGRLALADAMSYVQTKFKPTTMIDVATLTGACVVALGEYAAGLFSNDLVLQRQLLNASQRSGERCWSMPILTEHDAELKSHFADMSSTGKGRFGGASTAAAFLQRFVKPEVRWAHLDVAGPAMYSEARGYMSKGSTGFGVALLVDFLRQGTTK